MADTSTRTSEAEVEHFSGTILKRNRDGVDVISSTLEPGETLLSGTGQSEVEEAQPEEGQKTTETLSRASAQQEGDKAEPVSSPEATEGAKDRQQSDVDKTAVTTEEKPNEAGGVESRSTRKASGSKLP